MCPFFNSKPELCKAALSSLMIDKKYCFSETYDRCAIFLIKKSRKGGDRNVSKFQAADL
jgi:hypothetical protein